MSGTAQFILTLVAVVLAAFTPAGAVIAMSIHLGGRIADESRQLRAEIGRLVDRINGLDTRLARVEERLTAVDQRLGQVEIRLLRVEERLGGVEERLVEHAATPPRQAHG